jgi:hypothetical protein
MSIKQTRIPMAGVLRCCLESVATEFLDPPQEVNEGQTSACKHCGMTFTLRQEKQGQKRVVWWPDEFGFEGEPPKKAEAAR